MGRVSSTGFLVGAAIFCSGTIYFVHWNQSDQKRVKSIRDDHLIILEDERKSQSG